MKITVVNGNTRHGSTWHCMDIIRQALSHSGHLEVTEFSLPRDMPHFCRGCFSCFVNGEQTCPHAQSVQPIAAALLDADLIILTSPVYALDVSGQLKALLDHLCYLWMPHRPDPKMFCKVGLAVTTTAGAGLGHTAKTMRNSLKFWGCGRVLSCKMPVSALKWSDVSDQKKAQVEKEAARLAKRISGYVKKADTMRAPLLRSFLFWAVKSMMRKNDWNPLDRKHWEDHGWIKSGTQIAAE